MFSNISFRVPIFIAPKLTMLPGEKLGWRGGRHGGLATPMLTFRGPILHVYALPLFPYLTFGQTLKAVMYDQHTVALDKADPHSGANSSIHASSWGPHIHHGHCVCSPLFRG